MNIFVLDRDIALCAQYHCDKHVVKMITETAQLLSGVYYAVDQENSAPYRLSHERHPHALWLRESFDNWLWLATLGIQLYREYAYRYGNKEHKAGEAILQMLQSPPVYASSGFSDPPQCMPEEYKRLDVVQGYRAYYNGEKRHIFSWTGREIPYWIEEE